MGMDTIVTLRETLSDLSPENDPRALPGIEVFYVFPGPRRPRDGVARAIAGERGTASEDCEPGWYWRACFHGPSIGPFDSEHEAIERAQL